jgi:hypothetical protein
MKRDPLIEATDAEVILDPISIGGRVVTFQIIGTLQGTESIAFEVEDPAAEGGWRTMSLGGDPVSITLGNDQVTFYAPAYVRPHKSATIADCGLRDISAP